MTRRAAPGGLIFLGARQSLDDASAATG